MTELVHEEEDEEWNPAAELKNKKLIPCKFCSKLLSHTYVKEHQDKCIGNPVFDRNRHKCGVCGQSFSGKRHLVVHLKTCSVKSHQSKKQIPCMFENCSFRFFSRYALVQHLNEIHKCDMEVVQKHTFNSFEEFQAWKDSEEQRTYSYFSKKCGEILGKTYYYCQHDGSSKPHKKSTEMGRKTNRRRQKGVVKKGKHCIATMKLTWVSNDKFELSYFPSHSHPLDVKDLIYHPQSPAVYKFIDKQLALGVPPEKICDDLKKALPNGSTEENPQPTKVSFITEKQIKERARSKFRAIQRLVAVEEIGDRHSEGMNILDDCVKCVTEEVSWKVLSYRVSKYQEKCTNVRCVYTCKAAECSSLCMHLYECTCQDQNPLCKHIHKVHSLISREVVRTTNKDSLGEEQLCQSLEVNLHKLTNLLASGTIPYSVALQVNDSLGQIVDYLQPFSEFHPKAEPVEFVTM